MKRTSKKKVSDRIPKINVTRTSEGLWRWWCYRCAVPMPRWDYPSHQQALTAALCHERTPEHRRWFAS